ncbi:hypothetical protein [Enterococcus gallinarum]|uniref:hypothetical protein n=1 Tax=Enterococcus gallinarum TaxID=1353 RepID=UPI0018AAAC3D|nr:hypothetical protein [Enterococcus gallinarum]
MMEKIKSRPLSHYYLWKVCQRFEKDPLREIIIPPLKSVIGQLNAERRNLEKANSEILAIHISSIAFLEEMLKTVSEQSFRKLIADLWEEQTFQ